MTSMTKWSLTSPLEAEETAMTGKRLASVCSFFNGAFSFTFMPPFLSQLRGLFHTDLQQEAVTRDMKLFPVASSPTSPHPY